MTEIVDGPNRKKLISAFNASRQVTIKLVGGTEQQLTIKTLEHNGTFFNFVAENGDYGHYATRQKHGQINSMKNDPR